MRPLVTAFAFTVKKEKPRSTNRLAAAPFIQCDIVLRLTFITTSPFKVLGIVARRT
jgi:hypothetical protein